MIRNRPLIFWIALSLGLHIAGLVWCPFPSSFRPPYPIYLVVDLFSGPTNSESTHGLNDNSGGGRKSALPEKVSPIKPLTKPLQTSPKHPITCAAQDTKKPLPAEPTRAEKINQQNLVPLEPKRLATSLKQPPAAAIGEKTTTAPVVEVSAEPLTSRQDNLDQKPKITGGRGTGPGYGSGTGSGSGSGQGRPSGSGSPVETPFAYGSNPPPPYPSTARRRGWEGEVLLLVNVTARGEVSNVTVSRSSGYQILDRAALNAVYRWQFQAALRNGRAVAGKVVVPIRFSIQDAK
jgi:protein TonB